MSKDRDRIVYRRDDGQWANKRNDAVKASGVHSTQGAANQAAREMLKNQGGGELTTQGIHGRIVSKDTIAPGNDPCPPRDNEHLFYGLLRRHRRRRDLRPRPLFPLRVLTQRAMETPVVPPSPALTSASRKGRELGLAVMVGSVKRVHHGRGWLARPGPHPALSTTPPRRSANAWAHRGTISDERPSTL